MLVIHLPITKEDVFIYFINGRLYTMVKMYIVDNNMQFSLGAVGFELRGTDFFCKGKILFSEDNKH